MAKVKMLKRNPKNFYTFHMAYGRNFIRVTRDTPYNSYSSLYLKSDIPQWAVNGMKMLDVARDPSTGKGLIPGHGRVRGSTYTFFPQLEDVPM